MIDPNVGPAKRIPRLLKAVDEWEKMVARIFRRYDLPFSENFDKKYIGIDPDMEAAE
jgi:hypothetical protein